MPTPTPSGAAKKLSDDPCMACHLAHTNDPKRQDKLWAGPFDETAVTPSEQRCLGCHDNQNAPRPDIPVHPTVVFSLLDPAAAGLPAGTYMPTQQSFPCGTCHLPHGSGSDDQKKVATIATTQPADLALELRTASRPLLRPDVATRHLRDLPRL